MTTDKSKSQAWDELREKSANNECMTLNPHITELRIMYYNAGVDWTLNNLDKVPQYEELLTETRKLREILDNHRYNDLGFEDKNINKALENFDAKYPNEENKF